MTFINPNADLFIPDGAAPGVALGRTTHLCIAAHQDDQEFMAYHGILECFGRRDRGFTGVVVTDGAGSARQGLYADFSPEDMKAIRYREQRKAATIGEYSCQIQLGYTSAQVKNDAAAGARLVGELAAILDAARPSTVYLHNPADKHDTHVAVMARALEALRTLSWQPEAVHGCEVWRSLDWLCDADKLVHVLDAHPTLAASISGVFDSQISAGKRYDLAVQGRRMSNATFFDAFNADQASSLAWAIDLTPLVRDRSLDIADYVLAYIDRFREDVAGKLKRFLAR